MARLDIVTIPESRNDDNVNEEYLNVLDEKNKLVAKRFKIDELDVTMQFYDSKGALVGSLGPNVGGYGIYSGHVDGTQEIKILHPAGAEGLLDDIPKETAKLIEMALTKYYLCQKYYPNEQDFKLYYKTLAEYLAKFSAEKHSIKSCKFDIKLYFDGIKYKKDQELNVALYLMIKNSGLDFVYDHLDTIMKDAKISKSVETIYNKPLSELIKPEKEAILEEDRKIAELEKQKRAAQREAMINERKERELKQAQNQRQGNGDNGPRRVHVSSRNFGNNNNNNNNNQNRKYNNNNNHNSNNQNNNSNNSNNGQNRNYNRNNNYRNNNNSNNNNNQNKRYNNNNSNNQNRNNNRPNNNNNNNSNNNQNKNNEPANKPQKFAIPKVN